MISNREVNRLFGHLVGASPLILSILILNNLTQEKFGRNVNKPKLRRAKVRIIAKKSRLF